jgi:hypothetical protein
MEISAFLNSIFWTIVCCYSAVIWYAAWYKVRHTFQLILSIAWFVTCVGWVLAAIANGPNPSIARDDAIPYIRACLFGGAGLILWGKTSMLFLVYQIKAKKAAVLAAEVAADDAADKSAAITADIASDKAANKVSY